CCDLCGLAGDHAVAGRLLCIQTGEWVHLNCVYYSSAITLDERTGAIQKYTQLKNHCRNTLCCVCNKPGASIKCCCAGCPRCFHFVRSVSVTVRACHDRVVWRAVSVCVGSESQSCSRADCSRLPCGGEQPGAVHVPLQLPRGVLAAEASHGGQGGDPRGRADGDALRGGGHVAAESQSQLHLPDAVPRVPRVLEHRARGRGGVSERCTVWRSDRRVASRLFPVLVMLEVPAILPAQSRQTTLKADRCSWARSVPTGVGGAGGGGPLRGAATAPARRGRGGRSAVPRAGRVLVLRAEPAARGERDGEPGEQRVPRRAAGGLRGVQLPLGAAKGRGGDSRARGARGRGGVGEASVPSPTAEASVGWSCSRCVAIRTAVEPLAWTLSTLRQTGQGEAPRSRWLRSESVEATSTAELLRQYRLLQVGVWGVSEGQTRSASEQPVVIKSPIQGWGLFASSPLMKGMMVMEFVGEVVSQEVANAREAVYEEMEVGGCYFFRLDAEHIVDATVKGNESRFINHCCDPR
ncbi:hypothetical protein BLSTO_05059, partial [Blastocystis sp. subtype 1]